MMDKKQLSEQEIRTRYITPAIERAGWDIATQVREEFKLTDGRLITESLKDYMRNKLTGEYASLKTF